MLNMGLTPDTATVNAFVQNLCNCKPSRYKEALEIISFLQSQGLSPDDFTYRLIPCLHFKSLKIIQ